MQGVESQQRKGWRWMVVFLLIALLVVTADQLSKLWIKAHLAVGESIFEVGFFRFTHVQNTGAIFGLFPNHTVLLSILAFVGMAALLFFVFFTYRRFPYFYNTLNRIALGLILGGTLGNQIERLSIGYVTDFINFGFWPAFNIADASVTIGSIILAYSLLRLSLVKKHSDG